MIQVTTRDKRLAALEIGPRTPWANLETHGAMRLVPYHRWQKDTRTSQKVGESMRCGTVRQD